MISAAQLLRLGDREDAGDRRAFMRARRTNYDFGRRLRGIAQQIDRLVRAFDMTKAADRAKVQAMLREYAKVIEPWAESTARLMMAETMRRDGNAWALYTRSMSEQVRRLIRDAPVGQVVESLVREQVGLITSLPLEAATRVQTLSLESLSSGARPAEIVAEIMRTGEVTKSRANLIARTETGRASTALTQARAASIGSAGYIWRTVKDSDVRQSHKKMEGKFVAWSSPPTLDGMTGHAGALPNCRCTPEPVIPERLAA